MSDKSWDEVMAAERRKAASMTEKVVPLHAVEGDAALPGPDDLYQAVRYSSQAEVCLCVIMGASAFRDGSEPYRFFQYVHLNSNATLGFTHDRHGEVLHEVTLRFTDIQPTKLILRGHNLLKICHNINRHRVGWIRLRERGRISTCPRRSAGRRPKSSPAFNSSRARRRWRLLRRHPARSSSRWRNEGTRDLFASASASPRDHTRAAQLCDACTQLVG